MVSAEVLELGKGAFVACCALLALSVALGIVQLLPARPVTVEAPIEWPKTWAEILAEREPERGHLASVTVLGEWRAAEPHHRTLHCAHCGRFARIVAELPGVADCADHGMTARITYLPERAAVAA